MMQTFSFILEILLGVGFLLFGGMKFGSKQMVEEFQRYGYPGGFRIFTGLVEITSAVLIFIGIWNELFTAWGSFLMVATMVGAIFTHIKVKDPMSKLGMPLLLLILSLIVLLLNFQYLMG
ncbi:DoxX family protein [Cytobacillus spongiae]|jgi:uncharacterized membrane protein YphA (DoxX/SURF4 family)|uniref:DoxX family protein n=1 Tax=Cytobacillus spongiae TaxID=2901381 RepID=UPI001F2B397B|nr:DoxX family protein [Cytobacillus spongiae]UII55306.1 DoxX family protein [Cytobacillus spongiae]